MAELPRQGSIRTQLVEASAIATTRVDVRGMDAEDAWMEVDRAVDRCLVTGMGELEIIHGKGTGAVRARTQEFLTTDRRVREFRLGVHGEGGSGVTVARLA